MDALALLAKEGPPPPLSTRDAVLGIALVLAGVLAGVAIATVRGRSRSSLL